MNNAIDQWSDFIFFATLATLAVLVLVQVSTGYPLQWFVDLFGASNGNPFAVTPMR